MSRNSFPMKFIWSSVQNVTTGAAAVFAPNPVGPQSYGLLITATSNTWVRFVDPIPGGAVASASQTVATPGVFTTAAQAFVAGQAVYVTGTAPGGITLGQVYYVASLGLTATTLELATTTGGAGIQITSSAACTIVPLTMPTSSNSLLVKSTDFAEEYGVAPGQYIATLQQTATGTVNIVELTH